MLKTIREKQKIIFEGILIRLSETLQARRERHDVFKVKKGLDSVGEGEGGMFQENSIETCILSTVKQITSPSWMHETSARTWCTGKI